MAERQHRFGRLIFDRNAIVRAALRAYVENMLARLDPLRRHRFIASFNADWTGNLQQGSFYNGDGCGNEDVVAWSDVGVVGLAYELGWGPVEQLGLSVDTITRGPNDVRGALLCLPGELDPALEQATSMLGEGEHREKLAGVGFWLYGDRVEGSMFDDPTAAGANRLAAWGLLRGDRLPLACSAGVKFRADEPDAAPIQAVVDAVTTRALVGPTALTPDELATLCPVPPDPKQLLHTQRALQKVRITWPGSPEIPE